LICLFHFIYDRACDFVRSQGFFTGFMNLFFSRKLQHQPITQSISLKTETALNGLGQKQKLPVFLLFFQLSILAADSSHK